MARSAQARLTREDYEDGATAEFDAESGLLNPGSNGWAPALSNG